MKLIEIVYAQNFVTEMMSIIIPFYGWLMEWFMAARV